MKYDINNLYETVFGYVAPPYPWGGIPDAANLVPLRSFVLGGKAQNKDAIRMATVLSTPELTYPLPNEPIISIGGGRMVQMDPLYGIGRAKGTVKEFLGYEDHEITIQGLIVNLEEDDYPEQDLKLLKQILGYEGAITIQNDVCRIQGITSVVATKWAFDRQEGEGVRYQRYNITLVSDEDFELEII